MTNLEHYLKDILNLKEFFAISKKTGKVENCERLKCKDCQFNVKEDCDDTCYKTIMLWMFEKYKSPISNLEYEILDYLYNNTKFRYIARDEAEWLYAYYEPPVKGADCWEDGECYGSLEMLGGLFDFVKWSDEKPTSICEILEKGKVIGDGNY